MGAEPRNVVRMVVRDAVGLESEVAIGMLASLLFSQTLASLLLDVAPLDVATLAGVSLLLLAMAAAAAWSPARRASRVDPLEDPAYGVGVHARRTARTLVVGWQGA